MNMVVRFWRRLTYRRMACGCLHARYWPEWLVCEAHQRSLKRLYERIASAYAERIASAWVGHPETPEQVIERVKRVLERLGVDTSQFRWSYDGAAGAVVMETEFPPVSMN